MSYSMGAKVAKVAKPQRPQAKEPDDPRAFETLVRQLVARPAGDADTGACGHEQRARAN